jgi:predicted PurR-regulated permease PerM
MNQPDPIIAAPNLERRVTDLAIQLGVLFVVVLWCFRIIEPCLMFVIWGIIVANSQYTGFTKLSALLGERKKSAATLLTLLLIAVLIIPALMLTESLLAGAHALAAVGASGEVQIPPPPAAVADWPLIGANVYAYWERAATDLPAVLEDFAPQIAALGGWILQTATGTGLGLLQFIISFIIAGIFLASSTQGSQAAQTLATRLAADRGPEFTELASRTISNVALGIVGVSIVQTALISVGFLAIDMPGAGLAAFVVLILCVIQVGPGLVSLVAIVYAFSALDPLPATIFTIWTLAMTLIDSVLKPIVFGRGATVPTLVVFLGAIGGMLAYGLIGLFVGAVVLSLGFKLYESWLT